MHSDLPHREEMFQRESCCLDRMDVGAAALGDVLVHALGVGDKPGRVAAGGDFLAHAAIGRRGRFSGMGRLRIAVGSGRTDQYVASRIPACVWTLGVAPAVEVTK